MDAMPGRRPAAGPLSDRIRGVAGGRASARAWTYRITVTGPHPMAPCYVPALMARIFDGIKSFLRTHFEEDGLERDDEEDMLSFRLEDEEGHEWGCLAVAEEQAEQVMFYSVMLETVNPEHRNEVMRFVTMANYGMQVGNFELDLEDGEVRFKTSIDVEGVEIAEGLLRNLVELNLMMMGLYFDGMLAVMRGSMTAEQAIAEIEDEEDEEDVEDVEDVEQ